MQNRSTHLGMAAGASAGEQTGQLHPATALAHLPGCLHDRHSKGCTVWLIRHAMSGSATKKQAGHPWLAKAYKNQLLCGQAAHEAMPSAQITWRRWRCRTNAAPSWLLQTRHDHWNWRWRKSQGHRLLALVAMPWVPASWWGPCCCWLRQVCVRRCGMRGCRLLGCGHCTGRVQLRHQRFCCILYGCHIFHSISKHRSHFLGCGCGGGSCTCQTRLGRVAGAFQALRVCGRCALLLGRVLAAARGADSHREGMALLSVPGELQHALLRFRSWGGGLVAALKRRPPHATPALSLHILPSTCHDSTQDTWLHATRPACCCSVGGCGGAGSAQQIAPQRRHVRHVSRALPRPAEQQGYRWHQISLPHCTKQAKQAWSADEAHTAKGMCNIAQSTSRLAMY